MRLDIITIFPDYLAPLRLSLIGRAVDEGLIDLNVHDLRHWTTDKHRSVDDTPCGGGAGMLMRPEPWGEALAELLGDELLSDELLGDELVGQSGEVAGSTDWAPRVVVPTPAGTPFTQKLARELAAEPWLVFACGRYEGLDQRVLDEAGERARVCEVSLGDYVLSGGEVAVLAIVEAVARLLPGVIGNADSLVHESHTDGLLEGPAYTKPPSWHGRDVPAVLLSGNHARIARWRRDEALHRTAQRRPDLVAALVPAELDRRDLDVLGEHGWAAVAGEGGPVRLVRTSPPVAD